MDPTGSIRRRSVSTAVPNTDTGAHEDNRPLYLKYRPQTFWEVRGQDSVVQALTKQLESNTCPHVWLFVGPSGVGKTTLARIIARQLKVEDVQEIDAASNSGVEAIRTLVSGASYRSLLSDKKMVILDECHTLSKQAWQPLLKVLEEPPEHLYFALCTTESYKIPETIKTRAQEYVLKPAPPSVMEKLLEDLPETCVLSSPVKGLLMAFAEGSLRKLLSGAEKIYRLHDPQNPETLTRQAKEVLQRLESDEEGPAIALARAIAARRGLSWERIKKCLTEVGDNPEAARIVIVNYLTAVLLKSETVEKAQSLAQAIHTLQMPCYEGHALADLSVAVLSLIA